MDSQALTLIRTEVGSIIGGTVFVATALVMWTIAALRHRRHFRILVWLGVWSAMYGGRTLARSAAIEAIMPRSWVAGLQYFIVFVNYFMIVAASFAILELNRGGLRKIVKTIQVLGLTVGVAGYGWFLATGDADKFARYNSLLAVSALLTITVVILVPRLSKKYMVLADRRVLAVGTFLFAIQALYVNLFNFLRLPRWEFVDPLGFGIFLFSFAYSAAENVFAGERRLMALENELEIARDIQKSILPTAVPQIEKLRIAAAYHPMTAVAGDFYDFISADKYRAGFLVADVSGHGVPAALIASMIKVALQSCRACAEDPGAVLHELGRILSGQLHGQFVTAAYLWIDAETNTAKYSAAGHPPLLVWRGSNGRLDKTESNGLLFGVVPESEYPVQQIEFSAGDRFLLYTDGITETENSAGAEFGDAKLEQVVRGARSKPAPGLLEELLQESKRWRQAGQQQQDDLTLIVIDAV